ncbi:hypothetical protein KSP40_PGU007278 [Platanthera guangdongensis]|uniref:Uncharacterized protein n=1 Tax=Platanthera guangdongensis TaxID=2320717 RepID=A0ABR2M3F0_9ASPA
MAEPPPDIYELFCHYNSLYFGDALGTCIVSWDPRMTRSRSSLLYSPVLNVISTKQHLVILLKQVGVELCRISPDETITLIRGDVVVVADFGHRPRESSDRKALMSLMQWKNDEELKELWRLRRA